MTVARTLDIGPPATGAAAAGVWRARWRTALLLAPALVLLALFLVSVARMLALSLDDGGRIGLTHYVQFFARADYVETYLRTVQVSLMVTALSIAVGYPLAYGIWRYPGNRNILMILILLPWLVSVVVRTYAWMVILGPRGLINEALAWMGVIDAPLKLMFNTTGVVIGLAHVLMPFMIISILSVLLHLDHRLEEASMSLGGNRAYTFARVTWPLSLPGVISGATLVYLMCTGAIVTPLLLGGIRERMIGTQIYQEVMQTFNFPKASALATLLLLGGLLAVLPLQWLERRVNRRNGATRRPGGAA
jgi:putative spermidine/putrescine transport system permease protein